MLLTVSSSGDSLLCMAIHSCLFLAIAFCAGAISADAATLTKVRDSVVDPEALYFIEPSWGNCVNGQSFQQDALTTFKGFQYATYYDGARRLCIARRPVESGNWEIIRFGDHHFRGNNTHNVAVLGICERDGTIHLSFDHHATPLRYRASRPGVALRPKEFSWNAELFGAITNEFEPGKPLSRVTYPRFVRTPTGGLQFGCRIGGSGNGDKCLADYDPASRTWKDFGAYVGGQGAYGASQSRNGYLNGLTYDRKGRLHVSWCWRETGNPMTNHDLGYGWSDDGGKRWFNSDGERIAARGEPITIDSPGARIAEIQMRRGLMNAMTQAVDSRGRIHIVTFHLPDDVPEQKDWNSTRPKTRYFHYWRDDKGKWQRNEMSFNGGRPQLWFDSRDNAFLVFTGDRFNPSADLCIASATARGRWNDWKIVHRERGPFTGQPQIDRHAAANHLSVYIQEEPTPAATAFSPLRVVEFRAKR